MKLSRLSASLALPLSIFLATLIAVDGVGNEPVQYCQKIQCAVAAEEILVSLNQSVDACTDFYEHACGGWKAMNPVSEDYAPMRKNRFGDVGGIVEAQLSELFNATQVSDIEALRKAKTFYDSCMDLDAIEQKGLTPLVTILTENGEWPLIVPTDKWNPQNLAWQQIHENFAKQVGVPALFDVQVKTNRSNSSVHTLSLSVPMVPSERLTFFARPKRDVTKPNYMEYILDATMAINGKRGFNVEIDHLLNDIAQILFFENKLDELNILQDTNGMDNGNDFRVTTIEAVQSDWDAIVLNNSDYSVDWLKMINDRFNGTGIVIDKSESITLEPANYTTKLAQILIETPIRTIVNYMHWKATDILLPFTNTTIRNPSVLPDAVSGRSGRCIMSHKMNHAVSYMYVNKYWNAQSERAASEIIEQIREEIKLEISASSWLNDAMKSAAREKVDAMTNFIGYPEWYDDSTNIDEYYSQYTVGSNYFENVLRFNQFAMKKKLSKLRSPASKNDTEWFAQPHIVNAEYSDRTNSLSFPAAILQSPLFVYERSSVLNYGAFGAIAGHEISHGFDHKGRLYDKDGNKRKWWTQSTIDTYKTKAQCFIDQYNNYVIYEDPAENEPVNINGVKTQGENIADTTGFRAGLRAYQRAKMAGKTNNVKIQRLKNFTDEQLYFYSIGSTLCESVTNRGLRKYKSDEHSPNRWRIIGALSNMQEFADAFNCPVGSPMNPLKKCLLWD